MALQELRISENTVKRFLNVELITLFMSLLKGLYTIGEMCIDTLDQTKFIWFLASDPRVGILNFHFFI